MMLLTECRVPPAHGGVVDFICPCVLQKYAFSVAGISWAEIIGFLFVLCARLNISMA